MTEAEVWTAGAIDSLSSHTGDEMPEPVATHRGTMRVKTAGALRALQPPGVLLSGAPTLLFPHGNICSR